MKRKEFDVLINNNRFQELFITEMGWNNPASTEVFSFTIDDVEYCIEPVAEKSGFQVYSCDVNEIPTAAECKKIDNQLRRYGFDYICIFVQQNTSHHLWLTPVKTNEKRELVKTEYLGGSQADFLYTKMDDLSFDLTERVLISDVKQRVQGSFHLNSEKVTKDFYAQFRKEHKEFAAHIGGLSNEKERDWYTSVMLNRLMFCYFIQKKGFLDGDKNYLSNKLRWVQQEKGEGRFFETFYKGFLSIMFHDGLNAPGHDQPDFVKKYGRIPYLNGGMFEEHQLEKEYAGIDINDEAFERLFGFFNKWNWHLDTRLTASGKDINPDVLGYIFEQYINDRAAMGAYYTKEDITEYIGKNCILPFLMDKVKSACEKDFLPGGYVWKLLCESGDRYIYDAVKKGHSANWQQQIPDYIYKGVDTAAPNLLERRARWNEKTFDEFALPTEIWRETIERLLRCDSLLAKISGGEITEINDFITYNLDIRQFVYDLLQNAIDPKFVKAFYAALQNVTILDPTCGSGAFLFAAMNILEPLYEVCLDRMEEWNKKDATLFRTELDEINKKYRSNRQYFIFKSIILRNLYGVDIMVEATEIAKLRLFLKMVAVVEVNMRADNLGLDPLPDIDFNIRCGNTLVGYANEKELEFDLNNGQDIFENFEYKEKIELEMEKTAMTYNQFRAVQLHQEEDMFAFKKAKKQLRERLSSLNDILNRRLYSAIAEGALPYEDWKASHQPFHWLAEFYDIIHGNGGFDVIIGNPPYVVYNEHKSEYKVFGYNTKDCNDLYAFVIERSAHISNQNRKIGMIVPISLVSTDGFLQLRKEISTACSGLWVSNYSMRPGKLFEGAEKHLTIFIGANNLNEKCICSSKYHRWYTEERDPLFNSIEYVQLDNTSLYRNVYPKIGNKIAKAVWHKLLNDDPMAFSFCDVSSHVMFHTRKLRYFVQFLDRAPIIYNEDGSLRETSELKKIFFDSEKTKNAGIAIYLSTLFFWFFISMSDCRNLNKREVDSFTLSLKSLPDKVVSELSKLGLEIMDNLQNNSTFIEANYKKYGKLSMQLFQPRLSKGVADEIDKVLAKHYGFTEEELDFIINYDIKYRMGDNLNEEE